MTALPDEGHTTEPSVVRLSLLAAAVATSIALLTLAWIGTYSRMLADDYCTSSDVATYGMAGAFLHWYQGWSGRFGFHVLTAVVGMAGPQAIRILPGMAVLLIAAASIFAARRVTGVPLAASAALGLSIAWSIVGCAPDIFQALFWASGVLTYTVPLIVIATWIGLSFRRDDVQPHWSAHLLLFAAAGFAETVTAVLGGALVIAFALWPARRRALTGALIAVIAGTLLMVGAPGNSHRASRFERPPGSGVSMVSLDASEFVVVEALTAGASLLLVLAVSARAGSMARGVGQRSLPLTIVALAVMLAWALAAPLIMARAIMATPAPLRSLQPTHAVLVFIFCVVGWELGRRWNRIAVLAALSIVVLGIPLLRDVSHLTSLASGAAIYAREWDGMDRTLRSQRGAARAEVEAPAMIGRLHFVNESPRHWSNRCMARYYGIGEIGPPVR